MDKESQLIWEAYSGEALRFQNLTNDDITEVWGQIYFPDGEELPLDGAKSVKDFLNVNPHDIESIGDREIGDDANVYIKSRDGNEHTLTSVEEVQRLLRTLKSNSERRHESPSIQLMRRQNSPEDRADAWDPPPEREDPWM